MEQAASFIDVVARMCMTYRKDISVYASIKFRAVLFGACLLAVSLLSACGSDAATTAPALVTTASAATTTAPASATTATTSGATGTATAATCSVLNLNSLTEQQLTATIPDFPSRMIREFLEYRPYSSIAQFRQQIGKYVDASQVTAWEKYVYVPITPNSSDAATLKQIPGVDDTIAAALIAARPYASNDAFLKAVAAKVRPSQATQAACYIGS